MNEHPGLRKQACEVVLEWLRAQNREPQFLSEVSSGDLSSRQGEVVDRFLHWAKHAGFECQLVEASRNETLLYETHWTHRGSSFVGFKQPPPQGVAEDAMLLGCAALLENDWCRGKLS